MAGPIQSAIGSLLGSVGAAAALGKKLYDEGQAPQKEGDQKEQKAKAEKPMDQNKVIAKTLKMAQDKKLESPKNYIFDEKGSLLANYSEVASVLARQRKGNLLEARKQARARYERRLAELKQKHMKEGASL